MGLTRLISGGLTILATLLFTLHHDIPITLLMVRITPMSLVFRQLPRKA